MSLFKQITNGLHLNGLTHHSQKPKISAHWYSDVVHTEKLSLPVYFHQVD